MSSGVSLPAADPLDDEQREALERLAQQDDWVGQLARSILQSDNEVRT